MTTTKITNKELFNALLAMEEVNANPLYVEKINALITAIDKKNANRKPTKAQAENEEIKAKILEFMEVGKSYTVTDIQKAVGLDSNQKASALIRQLKESELVIRKEEKGKAYFTKA